MLHTVVIETANPAAANMLATWAGHMVKAAWDEDPGTGRSYPVRFDAFISSGDGVQPVPLDLAARPGALAPGPAAFVETLAGLLADAAEDARCGLVNPADLMESVAADLARLAQAPAPAPRAVRPRRVTS